MFIGTKKKANMIFDRKSKRWLWLLIVWLSLMSTNAYGNSGKPVLFSYFKVFDFDMDLIASRYKLVIWHNHPEIVRNLPALRQKDPNIKALLYRELFCILREETQLEESVGHYDWIIKHHPDWFQKDTSGNMVEIPQYPGRFMMDLGNKEWQEFWIERTLSDVHEGGWDGVFVDDALTSVRMHDLPPLLNYPDDASLQAAVYGFLQKVYTVFQAEDKLMLVNVSNSYDYPGLFDQWLAVTDGIMEEHCSGSSWNWGSHVGAAQLESMQIARQTGKWYLCMTYGDWEDTELADVSLATYLMGSSEKVAWSYRPYDTEVKRIPVDPAWIDMIGQPLGEAQEDNGIWSRTFLNGTIFLNPTRDPQMIKYSGEQYIINPHFFRKFIQRLFPKSK